ncbi:HK97 gp10 family phage protein [Nocardiopsis trehalosi]|uniref:HK97 gp10 family phage protein n=1 Tax=Nocardiopsis trehalosi TaxID=109329 RepID=UPI000AA0129D|nr:HK97 gp10 family phage protein [Nocardiopsis trehalosi]
MTDVRYGIAEFRRDLGQIPKELQTQLRPALREAARPVLADARRRASWSTRIPGAMRIATRFGRRGGVSVAVSRTRAPHARAWEDITNRGQVRHPVFGNRQVWASHRPRPFLSPAAFANADRVQRRVADTVIYTARLHGFR